MTIRAKPLIYSVLVLIALSGSVAALLWWMWRAGMLEGGQLSGVGQVLMLIVGMLLMAALQVLYGLIAIGWFARKETANGELEYKHVSAPWELNPLQIVGVDNSLALAQLRVEIEQELRRFYFLELNGERPKSAFTEWEPPSARRIIEDLELKGKMTDEWRREMDDVIATCDQAIHGKEIDTDQALWAIRRWERLLNQLRLPFPSSLAA